MSKIKEKIKHRFSDADLIGLASKISGSLSRNLSDLLAFGISQESIDALMALRNNFMDCTKDVEGRADLVNATFEKNNLRKSIMEENRMMTLRCKLKWGIGSMQEKSLGIKGMANFSDEKLLFTSRRVHSAMTEYLPALAEFGLTQEMLGHFAELNNSFEDAMILQKNIINTRESNTNERVKLSNELFSQISKYAELGKRVFEMTNEALYNDFIIHPRRKSKKRVKKIADIEVAEA